MAKALSSGVSQQEGPCYEDEVGKVRLRVTEEEEPCYEDAAA